VIFIFGEVQTTNTQVDIYILSAIIVRYIIIMLLLKQSFISWLLISADPAGRLASARREYLGGSSTKDDGGKHLRALPAPNQEGIEDMFLGSSTSKNAVSHIV